MTFRFSRIVDSRRLCQASMAKPRPIAGTSKGGEKEQGEGRPDRRARCWNDTEPSDGRPEAGCRSERNGFGVVEHHPLGDNGRCQHGASDHHRCEGGRRDTWLDWRRSAEQGNGSCTGDSQHGGKHPPGHTFVVPEVAFDPTRNVGLYELQHQMLPIADRPVRLLVAWYDSLPVPIHSAMPAVPSFRAQPPLNGREVRAFVADRREFPWFSRNLTVPFVDALTKATEKERVLLVYVLGALPVAGGPISLAFQPRQHTILEARDDGWALGMGRAEPRSAWNRWLSWLRVGEVRIDDRALAARYRVTGADAQRVLGPEVREALVFLPAGSSFAWAGGAGDGRVRRAPSSRREAGLRGGGVACRACRQPLCPAARSTGVVSGLRPHRHRSRSTEWENIVEATCWGATRLSSLSERQA